MSRKEGEMRHKIIENKDGTWSLYNQTEKRFIIESGTEIKDLKKQIDQHQKHKSDLKRVIR